MLAYVDFFLGGDEKRTDLPPRLQQRFPMPIIFGGDGSFMAPFSLQGDNILTSLMSQVSFEIFCKIACVCMCLRLEAGLFVMFSWLEAVCWLCFLGWRQGVGYVFLVGGRRTTSGYCQYGLLVHAVEEDDDHASMENMHGVETDHSCVKNMYKENSSRYLREDLLLNQDQRNSEHQMRRKKNYGEIIDTNSIQMLEQKRDIFYFLSFIVHNTKPVGHQDLVGLVISMLLLGDFSLVLLTLLQLYSISLVDVFLALFILPLGILLPFPAGINALFSHGPRRSAGLARVYALWNLTSLINVGVAFLCGYIHYSSQSSSSKKLPFFQPWNISMDESEWWIFPAGLVLCKIFQSQLVNWHVANLEIQDRSLYSNDFELFWQS
ncbi:uncharacterized protein LOC110822061 [Carica papaya]|uniref:uncharacterized protein LOC110822061 n=1 Tax=Carica papaya TaxID=3649 RepID=UPI000B8C7E9D|nr:uncharacterized protein LOC110822061 [Carica papaya]